VLECVAQEGNFAGLEEKFEPQKKLPGKKRSFLG